MIIKSASIEEYKTDFEKSNNAILIDDISGKIELVNEKFCQMFGYTKAELMKLEHFALIHPEDRDTVKKQREDRFKNKSMVTDECLFRGVKKNGSIIDLRTLSIPRFDENKEPLGAINFCWNITRSNKLKTTLTEREEELVQSELELQGILESTTDGILVVDQAGKVVKTNKQFATLWNLSPEVLESEKDDDVLIRNALDQVVDPDQFLAKVQKLNKTKENVYDVLHLKDGRIFERYSRPLLIGEEGFGRIWSFRDVTDRINAEKALKNSEEKYRSLIENSPIIIMRLDRAGKISFINYKYAEKNPEDLIGKCLYDFIPQEFKESAKNTVDRVFETGQSLSFENVELNTYENVKWFSNSVSPEGTSGASNSVILIATDITELKQLDIMRNEFVASVSHEIRTPLTIIRESLSILESGITGELNNDQVDIVKPCLSEVDRLSRIINNLLDITKMDRQDIALEWEMVDIIDLAKGVLYSFQNQANNKSISLEFVTEHKELWAYCDRDRMIQVCINLIGNAIKFTHSGFVRLSIAEENNEILFTIADSGDGIDNEDLGTIFDRFHQVSKVNRAGEQGSGLGLTISKGIVKLHGGKIWVRSKVGVGSEFYFTLPKLSTGKYIGQSIDKIINESRSAHTKTSLLVLRIDNYEKLAKEFSSESVSQIRNRIFRNVEEEITIGDFMHRISDNEFIFLSNITKQNMTMMISKIKLIIKDLLKQYDGKFEVKISTGVAVFPDDGNDAWSLLSSAQQQLDQVAE